MNNNYDDEMIAAYCPSSEDLKYEDALELAYERDKEASEQFVYSCTAAAAAVACV